MKHLYSEVLRRFPEVRAFVSEGDEELPYVVVGSVVDWLSAVAKPALPSDVIRRVVDFDRWCMTQPRGATAADDIMTIEVVALREKLFSRDELLPLVPHLMSPDELRQAKDYLVRWVGEERYQAALRLADRAR